MTLATYASIRQATPGVTFTTASGGSLTAGTAWFCVQARNRVGKNLLSTPIQLTWSANQKIVVTFSVNARANGEEIFEYVISACPTNTPAQMKQIAAWRSNNTLTIGATSYPSQGLPKSLPATLELTNDAQLAICPTVANLAALHTTGMVYGAMRFIGDSSQYVRYDNEATAGLQAASVGYWVVSSQAELETFLASTVVDGGCDQPLSSIAESEVFYPPPPYSGNGTNSQPIRFWVSNGLSSSGFTIPAGMTIALQLFAGGREVSAGFADRLIVGTIGYVSRATGTFLPSPTTDQISWANTPLELPEDLPAGHAVVYELIFSFFQAQLAGIVTNGSKVLISFEIQGLLGQLDSVHALTGDVVLDRGDKLRIVPVLGGIQRLSGACLVGGYRSPFVGVANTSGLPEDSADLQVAISAAMGAAINVLEAGEPLFSTEGVRALISTEPGIQAPSSFVSVTTTGANPVISLAVTYPTTIRGDYPDVIGGMGAGFNVPEVIVYLQSGSTIYRQPPVTPVLPGQSITIDALGTVAGSLPASDPDFGLFGYNSFTVTPTNGASSLPNGSYQVRIAYSYPSPNTAVSKISHAVADGCVGEFEPLQDAINGASEVFTGNAPPISATGTENDVYLEAASDQLRLYRRNAVSWDLSGTVTAPPGVDGVDGVDGESSFGTLTAAFLQPASSAVVTASLNQTDWLAVGMILFVQTGGYYQVNQVTPTVQLINLGYPGNASIGTSIGIGSLVVSSGQRGTAGSAAFTALNANFNQPIFSESSPSLSEVSAVVLDSSWMAEGQIIFIEIGGYYQVVSINSTTNIDIRNIGYPGNAATGTAIAAGNKVTAGGLRGATGATGGSGGGGGGDVEAGTVTLTGGSAPSTIDTGQAALFYSGGILNLVLPDGDATGTTDGSPDFVPIQLSGLQTKWFGASELVPSTTDGSGALAAIATADPSYPTLLGLEFGNLALQSADLVFQLPREFDDTIALSVRPVFYGGGSFEFGDIAWGLGFARQVLTLLLRGYSTATYTAIYLDSETLSGNITQPAPVLSGGLTSLRILRDPANSIDTFAAPVYLIGVEVIYSTNKPNSSPLF